MVTLGKVHHVVVIKTSLNDGKLSKELSIHVGQRKIFIKNYDEDKHELKTTLKVKKWVLKYMVYLKNVKTLRKWAKAYYADDNPIATDDEYDQLYHKVMKFEMEHDIVNEKSPTQFVGWKE